MENTNKNEVALQRKQDGYIKKYNNALSGCEKSAWNLCKVIFETVNAEDFADVFGTMSNYAKALNVSKGSLSKYYKAYQRRMLLIEQNEENASYSVSQITEFSAVAIESTINFVEEEEVTPSDTTAEIRKKVKHYFDIYEEETTEETDGEETNTEETIDCECMVVTYNGEEIQVLNVETINKIKELLEIE